jgi:hypothetical protein
MKKYTCRAENIPQVRGIRSFTGASDKIFVVCCPYCGQSHLHAKFPLSILDSGIRVALCNKGLYKLVVRP